MWQGAPSAPQQLLGGEKKAAERESSLVSRRWFPGPARFPSARSLHPCSEAGAPQSPQSGEGCGTRQRLPAPSGPPRLLRRWVVTAAAPQPAPSGPRPARRGSQTAPDAPRRPLRAHSCPLPPAAVGQKRPRRARGEGGTRPRRRSALSPG